MSEQNTTTTPPTLTMQPNEWFPGQNWVRKQWSRLRLAHEGLMVDHVQRIQRIGEISARNSMTGDYTNTDGWPEDEEMAVNIGDHTHYHRTSPASLLAVGLAGGGLGAGILVCALWLLSQKAPDTSPAEPPKAESVTGKVRVFWGDKELKPGESAKVEVEEVSE